MADKSAAARRRTASTKSPRPRKRTRADSEFTSGDGHEPIMAAASRPKRAATRPRSRRPRPAEKSAAVLQPEPGTSEAGAATETEMPSPELWQELTRELEELVTRIRSVQPGYNPPPSAARGLMNFVEKNLGKIAPDIGLGLLGKLRGSVGEDLFDLDTWKGIAYMLNSAREYETDALKRRVTGDYETDEWGLDREFLDTVRPFFEFMYKKYWRVELSGVENVPAEGRALLVANHSGQLPWDGAMIATGLLLNHANQRLVRTLYATWFPTLPFVSDLFVKCGQVLANEDNGIRLLEQEELVCVMPEGYKGVGKLFKDRYRLARFGRGGFVRMALKTQAPILPVAVVGAEETYIALGKSETLARVTGFPYFPISPTFPWFGLLGFVPLPTKWYIDIGEPIPMDGYDVNAENNLMVIARVTDQVRNTVQEMIQKRLAQRRSVFLG